jgi:hypothetical protein
MPRTVQPAAVLESNPAATRVAIADDATWHDRRCGSRIIDFTRRAEQLYATEIDLFYDRYRSDLSLRAYTDPLLEEVREYLFWLRWVGWNATNLLPLSDERDDEDLAHAFSRHLLAYAALRLVDDGLDGHTTYKDVRTTLVPFVEARRSPAARHPEAYSVFLGLCVFNFARQRIDERSSPCALGVARLLDRAAVGVLAEGCADAITDEKAYEQIARRKAGAYNLMLYLPFLCALQAEEQQRLRGALVEMDVLAQLINDVRDAADDRRRRQPSAIGVYEPKRLTTELTRRVDALWKSVAAFPTLQREALAAMFSNLDLDVLYGGVAEGG